MWPSLVAAGVAFLIYGSLVGLLMWVSKPTDSTRALNVPPTTTKKDTHWGDFKTEEE